MVGEVHLGPVHTFHNEAGANQDGAYWYEPNYSEDVKLFDPGNRWQSIETYRHQAFEAIDASPFKGELKNVLTRYAIALDQPNLDVAFLMLWSLLERITGTVGGNYDTTIKRAIWFFKDRQKYKQILGQMRMRRNRLIHSAVSPNDRDQLCAIVKSVIDEHLISLVHNTLGVRDMEEYGAMLGLPSQRERLVMMRDRIQRALDMQSPPAPEDAEID